MGSPGFSCRQIVGNFALLLGYFELYFKCETIIKARKVRTQFIGEPGLICIQERTSRPHTSKRLYGH